MLRKISNMAAVLLAILYLWIAVSIGDVIIHNDPYSNHNYHPYNIICMVFD